MSHPLHGARPLDTSAGFPEAAAQISARWSDVADRGIIAAVRQEIHLSPCPNFPGRLSSWQALPMMGQQTVGGAEQMGIRIIRRDAQCQEG
jgi:hypothetical protein